MTWLLTSLCLLFNFSHLYDYVSTKRHMYVQYNISEVFSRESLLDIRVNPITCRNVKICVEILFPFHQDNVWTSCIAQSVCIMCVRNPKLSLLVCFMGGSLIFLKKIEWHTLSQDIVNFLHKFYLMIINVFNEVRWVLCNELMTAADTELEFPWCRRRIHIRYIGRIVT